MLNTLIDSASRLCQADKGFVYLWNASEQGPTADWLGTEPNRVLYPWNLRDEDAIEKGDSGLKVDSVCGASW